MRDTLILWDLPAPNEFGSPLEAVEAQISADAGANWSPLPDIPASGLQQIFLEQQPFGDWIIRLTVRDTAGLTDLNPVETPFRVEDNSPPSSVTNVRVTFD